MNSLLTVPGVKHLDFLTREDPELSCTSDYFEIRNESLARENSALLNSLHSIKSDARFSCTTYAGLTYTVDLLNAPARSIAVKVCIGAPGPISPEGKGCCYHYRPIDPTIHAKVFTRIPDKDGLTYDMPNAWWSDKPAISHELASAKYYVPHSTELKHILDSAGVRTIGFFVDELKPLKPNTPQIRNLEAYDEASVDQLCAWSKAKTLYKVSSFANSASSPILQVIKLLPTTIVPAHSTKLTPGSVLATRAYTNLTLAEHMATHEFWEAFFKAQPLLYPLFSNLTEPECKAALDSYIAMQLLMNTVPKRVK